MHDEKCCEYGIMCVGDDDMLTEKSKDFIPDFYPYLDTDSAEVQEYGWGSANLKPNAPQWAKEGYEEWKCVRKGLTKY